VQISNKYTNKCSTSLVIKEANQNHPEIPPHPVRTATIKKTKQIVMNVDKDMGKKEPSHIVAGNVN
jgi:hypothetical protein